MLERTPAARLKALAETAEAYVDETFGQELKLVPVASTTLPHFLLDRYALWQGHLNGRTLAVVAVRQPRQGVTIEYLKHREILRRELEVDLVLLLLDQAPAAIRRQMIERRIGFLAPGAQLYVPEAFLDLRERAPSFVIEQAAHVSPTTQFLLLALLQGIDLAGRNLTELADRLKVSLMSISRTLDELEALQLAKPLQVGRQRRLHMLLDGRELWERVEARLQSPLRKVRMVSGRIDTAAAPLAGESALAVFTMLSAPRIETRAVLAGAWKRFEEEGPLRLATPFDEDRFEIQTWTYDPAILADPVKGTVDPLSLYLSARKSSDERVQQAADEMLETMEW